MSVARRGPFWMNSTPIDDLEFPLSEDERRLWAHVSNRLRKLTRAENDIDGDDTVVLTPDLSKEPDERTQEEQHADELPFDATADEDVLP